MRVGLVLEQLLAPVPGGTGRYSAELARALIDTAGSGADSVHGVVAGHRDISAARLETNPAGSALQPSRLLLPPQLLARLWRRGLPPGLHGFDVVHAPTPLAPRSAKDTPLVVTVHDAVPWTHPHTLTAHGARWHREIIARAVADGAFIVTPTQAVADDLLTVLPGLRRDRVRPLGGGVSPSLLVQDSEPDAQRVLARLGAPEAFVLTVATLEPRKGLGSAIKALALLGSDAPTLVVVGQAGWGGIDPRAVAAAAGLAPDRLLLLGRRPDEDLRVLLRKAGALLMPSVAEGFGLPIAEAMALGTPVICSDLAALREVAGGAALLVPAAEPAALAQAIRTLCTDAQLAESMRTRGREQASRHSWPTVADRAWALYHELR